MLLWLIKQQSGGGQASISQRHLGSDVLAGICSEKKLKIQECLQTNLTIHICTCCIFKYDNDALKLCHGSNITMIFHSKCACHFSRYQLLCCIFCLHWLLQIEMVWWNLSRSVANKMCNTWPLLQVEPRQVIRDKVVKSHLCVISIWRRKWQKMTCKETYSCKYFW